MKATFEYDPSHWEDKEKDQIKKTEYKNFIRNAKNDICKIKIKNKEDEKYHKILNCSHEIFIKSNKSKYFLTMNQLFQILKILDIENKIEHDTSKIIKTAKLNWKKTSQKIEELDSKEREMMSC